MNEFDVIARYFAPLASAFPGSLNLRDDAALIDVPAGQQLIVTKDAITEGVHFIGNEDASLIARKLLRSNLSDLAAMGAKPYAYFLAVMLPKTVDESWLAGFASGLSEDQKEFGIHLAGGDTTAIKSGMAFSLTAFGLVPEGTALRRDGAKVGDNIYVSGTLGDGALGLKSDDPFLKQRYLLPQPRLELGQALRGVAQCAMDISDGLVQDLGHICRTSGVGARVRRAQLPLSPAAAKLPGAYDAALTGGDDYELLFTAAPEKARTLEELSRALQLPLTNIGEITEGKDVVVLDEQEKPLKLASKGYSHF